MFSQTQRNKPLGGRLFALLLRELGWSRSNHFAILFEIMAIPYLRTLTTDEITKYLYGVRDILWHSSEWKTVVCETANSLKTKQINVDLEEIFWSNFNIGEQEGSNQIMLLKQELLAQQQANEDLRLLMRLNGPSLSGDGIVQSRTNSVFDEEVEFKEHCWDPFFGMDIKWNRMEKKLFSRYSDLHSQQALDVREFFYQTVPKDITIEQIDFIQNRWLQKKFEATLVIMSEQGHETETSALARRFARTAEKEEVLNRFSAKYHRVSPSKKIKVVQTWVGIAPSNVETVCNTGLVDLRQTDKGYFGAGIYSTLQANYARSYSEGLFDSGPPNSQGQYCLVLCWVAVGNVYPISRDVDYENPPFSNFYHQKNGLALSPGFDSHCACVFLDERKFYQAAKFDHTTEKFEHDPNLLVDEIVVKESAQILPYCVVYYKKPLSLIF
jgi:hypothetical protein